MQPLTLVESYSTAPGTPVRAALLRALSTEATEDSDVLFILYAVAEAGTARGATARGSGGRAEPEPTRIELGEGFVNLETLLKEGDVRCDPSPHTPPPRHTTRQERGDRKRRTRSRSLCALDVFR